MRVDVPSGSQDLRSVVSSTSMCRVVERNEEGSPRLLVVICLCLLVKGVATERLNMKFTLITDQRRSRNQPSVHLLGLETRSLLCAQPKCMFSRTRHHDSRAMREFIAKVRYE